MKLIYNIDMNSLVLGRLSLPGLFGPRVPEAVRPGALHQQSAHGILHVIQHKYICMNVYLKLFVWMLAE